MRFVRQIFAVLTAAVLAYPAVALGAAEETPSWLIAIQGEVAAIDEQQIVISKPKGLAFTDRPERQVKIVDTAAVVAANWGEGGDFVLEPPNASLVNETDGTVGVITITDAATEEGSLTLTYLSLEGKLPAPGDGIALTIDSVNGATDPSCQPIWC